MSEVRITDPSQLELRASPNATVWYQANCPHCTSSHQRQDARALAKAIAPIPVFEVYHEIVTGEYMRDLGVRGFPAVVLTKPGAEPMVVLHGSMAGGFSLAHVEAAAAAYFTADAATDAAADAAAAAAAGAAADATDVEGGRKPRGSRSHSHSRSRSRSRSNSSSHVRGGSVEGVEGGAGKRKRGASAKAAHKTSHKKSRGVSGGAAEDGMEGGARRAKKAAKPHKRTAHRAVAGGAALAGGARRAVAVVEVVDSDSSDEEEGDEEEEAADEAAESIEGGATKPHKPRAKSPKSKSNSKSSKPKSSKPKPKGMAAEKPKRVLSGAALQWKSEVDAWKAKGFLPKEAMVQASLARKRV